MEKGRVASVGLQGGVSTGKPTWSSSIVKEEERSTSVIARGILARRSSRYRDPGQGE